MPSRNLLVLNYLFTVVLTLFWAGLIYAISKTFFKKKKKTFTMETKKKPHHDRMCRVLDVIRDTNTRFN